MKTKLSILIFTFIALLGTTSLLSCQQNKDDNFIDKIENEITEAKEDFNALKEDDPEFSEKLEKKLDKLETNLKALNKEMEQTAYKSNKKLRLALNDLQQKGIELKSKVEQWSEDTGDEASDLTEDIKKDFENFKESIKDWEYED